MDRALLVGAAEQPRPDGRLASAMGERRLHLAALSAAISQSGERLSYGLVRRAGGSLVLCVMSDTGRFRSMDVGCERVGDAWWFVQADTGEGLVPVLEVADAPVMLARLLKRAAERPAVGAAEAGGR